MSTEVGKIHYTLDLDDNKFQKSIDTVETKIKNLGNTISGIGQKLTTFVTLPIAGIGVASFKMAADLQDAVGATGQIFKEQADEMQGWADNLESFYGIAEGEALTYANTMGAMLQNIGGLTEEEAAKQSQTLLELAGDMTAMFGGNVEDAVRALTGSLKGNNTMLDNYGMAVNDAMIQAKALEMGLLKKGEALSLSAKQAATLALIEEQTADVTGQAAREADGASGSLRAMKTEIKNLSTEIGEVLIPIVMPLIDKARELIDRFKGLDDEQKKMIVTIGLVVAALGPLMMILGPLITLIGIITGVMSGPLLLIFGAIALIVMALANHFGGFRNMVEVVKNKLMELWNVIAPVLLPIFESMRSMIMDELVPALKEIWNMIQPILIPILKVLGIILGGLIVGVIAVVIGIIWALIWVIKEWVTHVKDGIAKNKQQFEDLKEKFKTMKNDIIKIKDDIIQGFEDMKAKIQEKIDAIKNKINGAADTLKKLNPLHRESPSLVDNVKKGANAMIKEYKGMFSQLDYMSSQARFNLSAPTMETVGNNFTSAPPVSLNVVVDNYYGDQIGLTNFTEKIMEEMGKINLTRG